MAQLPSHRHRTYNFIFLLSVEGSGPLSLGRCRGFGLGLGPACRALVGGTSRFRGKIREQLSKDVPNDLPHRKSM